MTWLEWLVVVLGVAATAVTVAWFLGARRFPERAASHDEPRPPED
jgi:hypothetical protein